MHWSYIFLALCNPSHLRWLRYWGHLISMTGKSKVVRCHSYIEITPWLHMHTGPPVWNFFSYDASFDIQICTITAFKYIPLPQIFNALPQLRFFIFNVKCYFQFDFHSINHDLAYNILLLSRLCTSNIISEGIIQILLENPIRASNITGSLLLKKL